MGLLSIAVIKGSLKVSKFRKVTMNKICRAVLP